MGPILPLLLASLHPAPPPALSVQVTAGAAIPAKTVRAAENQAARAFERAGVKLVWGAAANLQLQIVLEEPHGLSTDAAGFARITPGKTGYAAIFWPAVERAAEQLQVDPAIVLGAVLAHETGHLILGPGHAPHGIMSPHFGPNEMQLAARGELLFDGAQASRIIQVSAVRQARPAATPGAPE